MFWCVSFLVDAGGKVIHLVERAPPQTQLPSEHLLEQGPPQPPMVGTHAWYWGLGASVQDRNANSYVMVGTFNLSRSLCSPRRVFVGSVLVVVAKSS